MLLHVTIFKVHFEADIALFNHGLPSAASPQPKEAVAAKRHKRHKKVFFFSRFLRLFAANWFGLLSEHASKPFLSTDDTDGHRCQSAAGFYLCKSVSSVDNFVFSSVAAKPRCVGYRDENEHKQGRPKP